MLFTVMLITFLYGLYCIVRLLAQLIGWLIIIVGDYLYEWRGEDDDDRMGR